MEERENKAGSETNMGHFMSFLGVKLYYVIFGCVVLVLLM
jgi:hypothetical protein